MPLPNNIAVKGLCTDLEARLQAIRDLYAKDPAVQADAYKAQQEFALMQTPLKVLENTLANTKDFLDGD